MSAHHGIDKYVHTMKKLSEKRGMEISTKYAEGFRQHLGHSYPQENILKLELNDFVVIKNNKVSFSTKI